MVRAWDAFLRHVKGRPEVAFLRKDEIARYTTGRKLDTAKRSCVSRAGRLPGERLDEEVCRQLGFSQGDVRTLAS